MIISWVAVGSILTTIVKRAIIDILMTIFEIAHMLISWIDVEAAFMPLLQGKMIGLMWEERIVPMRHGIIFACFDDDLRTVILESKAIFDNKGVDEHCVGIWDFTWLVVGISRTDLLLIIYA